MARGCHCIIRDAGMKKALIIEANDVKKIIAEHFGVKESDVIKSQYSYTVRKEMVPDWLNEEEPKEDEEHKETETNK